MLGNIKKLGRTLSKQKNLEKYIANCVNNFMDYFDTCDIINFKGGKLKELSSVICKTNVEKILHVFKILYFILK